MVRTQGSAPDDNAIESEVQAVTETFAAGEQQQSGCRNAEVLRNKKHPFRWLVQWAQRQPVQLAQREPSAQ